MTARHIGFGRVLRGLLVLTSAANSSCQGTSSASEYVDATIDTIGGVVTVRNGPVGAWDTASEWSVGDVLRIGSLDDPDASFSSILLSATLSPSGGVYVVSFADNTVFHYDREGRYLRRFGGAGNGPGELTRPNAVSVDPIGRVWVTEHFSRPRRWSVFDSTGAFLKTVLFPAAATYAHRRLMPLAITPDWKIVTEMGDELGAQYLQFDTLGTLEVESSKIGLVQTPSPVRMPPDREDRAFLNERIDRLRWSSGLKGHTWIAHKGELRLTKVELRSGDTLRIVETTHRPKEDLSQREMERLDRLLQRGGSSAGAFPLVNPIVDAVHETEDGHVLVQIVETVGEPSTILDVFSPDGVFMGALGVPFNLPSHGQGLTTISGNLILTVTQDRLGVPSVIVARIGPTPP